MSSSITPLSNPDNRKDWVITVTISEPQNITLTVIPDKLIGEHGSLKNYLMMCAERSFSTPEEMALKIIEDVSNELVPKWIRVIYEKDGIEVMIEDQQPGFEGLKKAD